MHGAGYGIYEHSGNADYRDSQSDYGEAAEDDCIEAVRRKHLGANVLQGCGVLNRLVNRPLADDARNGGHERIRIAVGVDEEAASPRIFLAEGMIKR